MDKQYKEFEARYDAVGEKVFKHVEKLSGLIIPMGIQQQIYHLDNMVDKKVFELNEDGKRDHFDVRQEVIAGLSEGERAMLARVKELQKHIARMLSRRVGYQNRLVDIRRREIGRYIERKGMTVTIGELKQFIPEKHREMFIFTANLMDVVWRIMGWRSHYYDIHAPRTDDTVVTFYK